MNTTPKQTPLMPESIRNMFSAIAARYDFTNTVLSLGIHHLWKRKLVKLSQIKPGFRVLDCATGTGDLAFLFQEKLLGQGQVVGTDFCPDMLLEAHKKAVHNPTNIHFEVADVMNLPYTDDSFNVTSIAFGIRNVQNPQKGLAEMIRVTKPGGQLLVLEFGQPKLPIFKGLYNWYSRVILPIIGGWLTGDRSAYKYLQVSSAQFPCREDFLKLLIQNPKVVSTQYTSLSGGIAYIYQIQL